MSKGETSPFEVIFCFWNFQPGLCSSDFTSFLHKPSPAPSLPLTADSTGAARAWAQAAAQRQSPPPTPVRTALFQSCLRVQHWAANSSCTPRLFTEDVQIHCLSAPFSAGHWPSVNQSSTTTEGWASADACSSQWHCESSNIAGQNWPRQSLELPAPPATPYGFPIKCLNCSSTDKIVVSPPSKPKSHKHVQTGP